MKIHIELDEIFEKIADIFSSQNYKEITNFIKKQLDL